MYTSRVSGTLSLIVHDRHTILPHVRVDVEHVLHFFFSETMSMALVRRGSTSSTFVLASASHIEVLLLQFTLENALCSLIALVLRERSI